MEERETAPDQTYALTNFDPAFKVGTIPKSAEQVLYGVMESGIVLLFFDTAGELLRVEERAISALCGELPASDHSEIVGSAMQSIESQMQIVRGSIRVKRFLLADRAIGIKELPDSFDDFLRDPTTVVVSEEDGADISEAIRNWQAKGMFVFLWGKDYHSNENGEPEG